MMKLRGPVCDALGITAPIVQAPIGPAATPQLVAAVARAGGLGLLAGSALGPEKMLSHLRETRRLTELPFGVNFILEFPCEDSVRQCLDEGITIFSLFWKIDPAITRLIKDAGGTVLQTVASADDARRAAESGADVLVAQGADAGGHVRGQVGTMSLVPAVASAVPGLPLIAAGGIADGRGLAAAMMLGASGIWIGTRFQLSAESGAHDEYKRALRAARETDTVLGTVFDVGWPGAPARSLRNETVARWEAAGSPPAGSRPGEGETVAWDGAGNPLPRYYVDIPVSTTTGAIAEMCQYAGQGVGLVGDIQPAARIIANIVDEACALLGSAGRFCHAEPDAGGDA